MNQPRASTVLLIAILTIPMVLVASAGQDRKRGRSALPGRPDDDQGATARKGRPTAPAAPGESQEQPQQSSSALKPDAPASELQSARPDEAAAGFEQTVYPFVTQTCGACHNPELKKGGLNLLSFEKAEAVEQNRTVWKKVLHKLRTGEMPPPARPRPAPEQVTQVTAWIEARLKQTIQADPGRVTARRLNRAEYNYTIRDLLGVEVSPGDDFPLDDAGYGFDNIGDVLSLSPVLMEKYLAAAERIANLAIVTPEPIPPILERYQTETRQGPAGPPTSISRKHRFPAEGDYDFKVGVARRPNGAKPIKLALLLDGKEVKLFDVEAWVPKTREFDVRLRVPAGEHTVTAAYRVPEERPAEKADPLPKTGKSNAASEPEHPAPPKPNEQSPKPAENKPATPEQPGVRLKPDVRTSGFSLTPQDPATPKPREDAIEKHMRALGMKDNLVMDYVEIRGPYNAVPPPLPESHRRIFVCEHTNPTRQPGAPPDSSPTRQRGTDSDADPTRQPGPHPPGKHDPECARTIVSRLARLAWRRPVTSTEVDDLLRFTDLARQQGESFEQGIRLALQAMLISPHFLFRIERDPESAAGGPVHPVSDIELASRLSYFLWSSSPDEELLAAAERRQLAMYVRLQPDPNCGQGAVRLKPDVQLVGSQPNVLLEQVRRMLADAKSQRLIETFGDQWLQLRNLAAARPDPQRFPEFDEPLRDSMRRETHLFFAAILREDRSILDFIDADFTFVDERLAKLYGIPGVTGPEFRRVSLKGEQRGGVLTHASVLTVTSHPTRTSPVQRGKWILEALLNAPPPDPPPGVPSLDEAAIGKSGTLRQQLEKHRSSPNCYSCHARMDPLGFGLENYNAIGAWRTHDGEHPVDSAGKLPDGRSFQGPAQLKAILKQDQEVFARCLTEKLLTFALGRGLEDYDQPAVDAICRQLADKQYRFSALVEGIVTSLPFQMRRSTKAGDP